MGKRVVLGLDLKDFFPSITFQRVRGSIIAHGYSYVVASTLALLCTEYDREPFDRDGERFYVSIGHRHLVQGAPTSPALANVVAWRLDRRLMGLAFVDGTRAQFAEARALAWPFLTPGFRAWYRVAPLAGGLAPGEGCRIVDARIKVCARLPAEA